MPPSGSPIPERPRRVDINDNDAKFDDPAVVIRSDTYSSAQNNPFAPKPSHNYWDEADEWFDEPSTHVHRRRTAGRHVPPPPPPRDSWYRRNANDELTQLGSSTDLLEKVGDFDGMMDNKISYPRSWSSVYVTTYPFSDRDVQKWWWLFAHGVEDVFLTERKTKQRMESWDDSEDDFEGPVRRRGHHTFLEPNNPSDVQSIYLSRALDKDVISDEGAKEYGVQYLVVLQNRGRPDRGAKLMVAESRKAAGIVMFYEMLMGLSVVFVGAVVDGAIVKAKTKEKKDKKWFVKVDDLEGARTCKEGTVGVIC